MRLTFPPLAERLIKTKWKNLRDVYNRAKSQLKRYKFETEMKFLETEEPKNRKRESTPPEDDDAMKLLKSLHPDVLQV